MNNFLEEKEKLLNSIENNTTEHWKEYYKDVPIDCIFEDLVIDINEIKRLTEENQQLKEQLEKSEKARKEAIEYVKKRNFDRAEILVDMECEYYYDDDFKDSLLYILEKE